MMKGNKDVIEAARNAWNKLSVFMDEDPELFTNYEDFSDFYEMLVRKLFNNDENKI